MAAAAEKAKHSRRVGRTEWEGAAVALSHLYEYQHTNIALPGPLRDDSVSRYAESLVLWIDLAGTLPWRLAALHASQVLLGEKLGLDQLLLQISVL